MTLCIVLSISLGMSVEICKLEYQQVLCREQILGRMIATIKVPWESKPWEESMVTKISFYFIKIMC